MTNLNDYIQIQLTPEGVKFYKDYFSCLNAQGDSKLEGDMLTIQLWYFAQIFGQELYNGNSKPLCSMNFEYV